MIKAVAHAVTHAKVLELRLREQLVTHAAHFKFQSLHMSIFFRGIVILRLNAINY